MRRTFGANHRSYWVRPPRRHKASAAIRAAAAAREQEREDRAFARSLEYARDVHARRLLRLEVFLLLRSILEDQNRADLRGMADGAAALREQVQTRGFTKLPTPARPRALQSTFSGDDDA